jgi:hypothetical protein
MIDKPESTPTWNVPFRISSVPTTYQDKRVFTCSDDLVSSRTRGFEVFQNEGFAIRVFFQQRS